MSHSQADHCMLRQLSCCRNRKQNGSTIGSVRLTLVSCKTGKHPGSKKKHWCLDAIVKEIMDCRGTTIIIYSDDGS